MKSFFGKWGSLVAGPKTKWITLVLWIVLVSVLSIILPAVSKEKTNNPKQIPNASPSVQAQHIQKQFWPKQSGMTALIVWYRNGGLTSQDLRDIQRNDQNLSQHPLPCQTEVAHLNRLPLSVLKSMESKDGTTFVESVLLQSNTPDAVAQKNVKTIQEKITRITNHEASLTSKTLNPSSPGLQVRVTGPAGIAADTLSLFANVDVTLLMATVLLVLILLLLLYRSPLLAIIPLIGVGFTYGAISPILGWLTSSGKIVVDDESISIMTVLLFGAGTDYCLFLITRFREHLYVHQNLDTALKKTVQQSMGAIGMSALTVAVSLITLLLAKSGSIHRFAVPMSIAILMMALAGLTLVPALLSVFGRASFYPFIPRTLAMEEERAKKRQRVLSTKQRSRFAEQHIGKFSRYYSRFVTKRPAFILIGGVIVLGLLAAGTLNMRHTYNPLRQLPKSMQSSQGFALLTRHFTEGSIAPVQVIVNTEGKHVPLQKTIEKLDFVKSVSSPDISPVNAQYQMEQVTLKGDPYSQTSISEIPTLRHVVEITLQQADIHASSSHLWIGGETATQYDTQQDMYRDAHVIIPIVIGIIAILLLIYLRSIVAMLYLIATVLFSFFSSLGAGWLILHYIFGARSLQGGISLYVFIFLVSLGEDYNIFMVSRIWQEARQRPLKEAVALGVSRTSGVITSAGLILAGTFAVLTGMPGAILLDFGVIAAVGVLLDTFIIRPLIVPALTTIFGRFSFWPRNFDTTKLSD